METVDTVCLTYRELKSLCPWPPGPGRQGRVSADWWLFFFSCLFGEQILTKYGFAPYLCGFHELSRSIQSQDPYGLFEFR